MALKSDPRQWSDPRHRRGLEGERIAMRYLASAGWRIVAHRVRMGRWEVDLVIERSEVVAFVEVKTRRGGRFGSPLEAITWKKRREIARVARAWLDRHGSPHRVYRFDVVGVTLGRITQVEHVEDAFRGDWR
jgi:putative endonuclease